MTEDLKIPGRLLFASIIIAGAVIVSLGSWSCRNKTEQVTVGLPVLAPAYIPVYIARDQGFFAKNGLDVTIREYDVGPVAIKGMMNGEVNIAGASEYPIVERALKKDGIKIIAVIDKNQAFYLTGRKDRGIEKISDLKGKRVGVTFGGIGEFYLARFLGLHGLKINDVKLVNIKMTAATEAVARDEVDAVMVTQPNSADVEKRLGAGGITWPAQSSQPVYVIMASKSDWIEAHPRQAVRFLNALAQAEDFILSHPAEAKTTLRKFLNYNDAFFEENWRGHQFSLSLDQSIITAMEDETRWMMRSNLIPEKEVPDFTNYLYVDGLKAIRPAAVNIIR
jgi:NitT/TauT family transport system substrate-binding protein